MASDDFKKQTQKILSSLIISSAKELNVRRLRNDYKDVNGEDVPFKQLGYSTFEHFLLSIPETCRLIGTGDFARIIPVVTDKNKHINEMIMKQKVSSKSNYKYKPSKRSRGIYDNSALMHLSPAPQPPVNRIPIKMPIINPNSHKMVIPPPHDYFLDTKRQSEVKENIQPCSSKQEESENRISSNVTMSLVDNCSNLNISANKYDSDSDSYDEFLDELDFSNDDDNFVYRSDNEEDLTTCASNLHNLIIKDELPYDAVFDPPLTETKHESRVNNRTKEKLKVLISEHPDGIWCSKLLKLYQERFKHKLDPQNFGFSSVIQLCDDLPDVFHCIRPNRMDWKLYDIRKPVPDIYSMRDFSKYLQSLPVAAKDLENTEPPLPENYMHVNPSFKYPENVIHPDEIITRQWLENEEEIDAESFIEIIISEVYDPSKFWIQLKGANTTDALDKLMDDMQLYYMHNAGMLQLNEFSVRIGLFCAALFMNEYHRAVVIKVFSDQTIKVYYIDYGTVADVPLRRTCFLHKDFSILPQQAIRARLNNIIPAKQNTMWPREASEFMLQLVRDKILYCNIKQVEYKQQILNLIITDTSLPNIDIHINDELVKAGYAVLGNKAPMCETSSALVPNVHLYPAFEEIEYGIYPSVGDIIKLIKLGQTYETIFNGYFTHTTCPMHTSHLSNSKCSSSFEQSYTIPEESHIADSYFEEADLENISEVQNEEVISDIESQPVESSERKSAEEEITDKPSEVIDEPPEVAGIKKTNPPPGFENVKPRNYYPSMFQKCDTISYSPYSPYPIYPQNLVVPLVQPYPNYAPFNKMDYMNPALFNPYLHNQLLLQQREAYLRNLERQRIADELHRFAINQINSNFFRKSNQTSCPPNTGAQKNSTITETLTSDISSITNNSAGAQKNTTITETLTSDISSITNNSADLNNLDDKPKIENMYDRFLNQTNNVKSDSKSSVDVSKNESLSNISEHICERFVIELKFLDYVLHVLRIDDKFYVVSQEIVTNLLKSDLSLKKWLNSINSDTTSFPNKLVDIAKYDAVYIQMKKFIIPGVYQPNNLGCNVRLTSLNDVVDIVYKYGNRNMLAELKFNIKNVVETPYLWKVLDSSD